MNTKICVCSNMYICMHICVYGGDGSDACTHTEEAAGGLEAK